MEDPRSIFYTDRYCLGMSQMFWRQGLNDLVSFELFVRKMPPDRGYMIAAGLGTALWWIEKLKCGEEEWEWLIRNGYDEGFATFLWKKSENYPHFFTGDIHAIAEGTPIAAGTPILRVTAPRIDATLIESLLLSSINHQTMVASKAARIVDAASDRPVADFSMRRGHGVDASFGVARAAYIAGFASTATVQPGRVLGIPTTGTMAHHVAMAHYQDEEQEVFQRFIQEFPETHAILVDTFDWEQGIRNAVNAASEVGIPLKAIRLDSGNLDDQSRWARDYLDDHDCDHTKILASNDLDEYSIDKLVRQGAPIDGFGVGTMLATVPDAPNLGGVYKLVEQHERDPRYVMKFAQDKVTDPGSHQVWRTQAESGYYAPDLLAMETEKAPTDNARPLLSLVMKDGCALRQPKLQEMQRYCVNEHRRIDYDYRKLGGIQMKMPLERSSLLKLIRAGLGDATV